MVYCTTMGTLFVVATPIGNLDDISLRALRILFSVGVIACEDTRRTGGLLHELETRYATFIETRSERRLVRYDNLTEQTVTSELLGLLREGTDIALVSDAGTPLVSDPGFILVREAGKRSVPITSIPGASALLTALTSSGLSADKFTFLGYPPEKQGPRVKLLEAIYQSHALVRSTYVFYVSPHKLLTFLEDMKRAYGDIPICIGRELTKRHEENWKGLISESLVRFAEPKGEFVVLFELV